MPADVPADIPTDMTAHAIEGCDHMTTGDGSNPADFGTMQLFTLQGIMTFLCVFGWTGIICTSLGLHAVSYTHLDVYKRQMLDWIKDDMKEHPRQLIDKLALLIKASVSVAMNRFKL